MKAASSDQPIIVDPAVAEHLAGGLTRAIYFESAGQRLFGWLGLPDTRNAADLGLVICKPFGYEAICSHRSLRIFAENAVELGLPTLRVDYLGTGDSAEIEPQADQLQAWVGDVSAAIAELRRLTGVRKVCLLGVRLGALLCLLAADGNPCVTSLILISPVLSGRRYTRELRTTKLAAGLKHPETPEQMTANAAGPNAGALEVSGFSLSAATLTALASVDLSVPAGRLVSHALILDGQSFATSQSWAKQLSELGVDARYLALPGLVEMLMTAPQVSSIPMEMVSAIREWLSELSKKTVEQRHDSRTAASMLPDSTFLTVLESSSDAAGLPRWSERPVFFGSDISLFGIVTEPRRTEVRKRAVVLLNAGADVHVGVNAINVTLARRWAESGYVTLRMDLGGLGDSATRTGRPINEVFPPKAIDDIRAGLELIRNRYQVQDVTLFGLCSGAYHALKAAAAQLPVKRILMVNPQNYFWREGQTLDTLQIAEVVLNPGIYNRQIMSWAAWKRLMTGQVNAWRIAKIYLYRPLLAFAGKSRDLARRLHLRLPDDLGSELEEIAARGVRIVFIFSRGDPGLDLLKIEAGSSFKRLGERCTVHVIDGADHVFSQSAPRAVLTEILSKELFAQH